MGPITTIISGACRGADRLAVMWAKSVGVPVEEYPANWGRYGKAAGPIRNLQMLKDGKPDLVVAFSGGHGTLHMMNAEKGDCRGGRGVRPRRGFLTRRGAPDQARKGAKQDTPGVNTHTSQHTGPELTTAWAFCFLFLRVPFA